MSCELTELIRPDTSCLVNPLETRDWGENIATVDCLIVCRLKTGCVPPSDLQFEEYLPGVLVDLKQLPNKKNSLIRVRSKQSLCKGGNVNYYQMKRDLEKKIDSQESELLRGGHYWLPNEILPISFVNIS